MLFLNKPYFSRLVLILILLTSLMNLAGCGFHMRGYVPIPPQLRRIYIETDTPYDPLIQELKKSLTVMRIIVVDSPQDAAVLHIISQQITRSIGSISANTNTLQYTLFLWLTFELYLPPHQTIINANTISTSKNLIVNNNQILGSNSEENTLIQEMRQTLVQMLETRLGTPNTVKQFPAVDKNM